jgi:hypothetical protein
LETSPKWLEWDALWEKKRDIVSDGQTPQCFGSNACTRFLLF